MSTVEQRLKNGETEDLPTIQVKPKDLMQGSLVFSSLHQGAIIGTRFDLRHYKTVHLVDVMCDKGTKLMPYDGHRRIRLAERDGVEEIEALNVTMDLIRARPEKYRGQTAFTPVQHTELMRELHNGESDDRRIVSQILTEWRMNVGDDLDTRTSAFAALTYLSFSNLQDKIPSEIATILKDPQHSKHPGDLLVDQTEEETKKIIKGISSMADSIYTVDIVYQDMMRHGVWVVQTMLTSEDEKMQEKGRKQIRGLLSRPEIKAKKTLTAELVTEKEMSNLEELVERVILSIDTDAGVGDEIRFLNNILFNSRLPFKLTTRSLKGTDLEQEYNIAKREVNSEILQNVALHEGKALSDLEKALLMNIAGTVILDPETDKTKIGKLFKAMEHAHSVLIGISQEDNSGKIAGLVERVMGAESKQVLSFAVSALEKELSKVSKEKVSSSAEPAPPVKRKEAFGLRANAKPIEPKISGNVVFESSIEHEPDSPLLTAARLILAFTGPAISPAEHVEIIAARDKLNTLIDLSDASKPDESSVQEKAFEEVAIKVRKNAQDILGAELEEELADIPEKEPLSLDQEWEERRKSYNFRVDGTAAWFADRFIGKPPVLSEEDRHKVTFVIEEIIQKKFPALHREIIPALTDKNGNVGLTAIDSMISERIARLAHEAGWGKDNKDYNNNHHNFELLIGLFVKRAIEVQLDTDESLLNVAAGIETVLSDHRKHTMMINKSDPYAALLEFLLYSEQSGTRFNLETDLLRKGSLDRGVAIGEVRKYMPDGANWTWTIVLSSSQDRKLSDKAKVDKQKVESRLRNLFITTFFA